MQHATTFPPPFAPSSADDTACIGETTTVGSAGTLAEMTVLVPMTAGNLTRSAGLFMPDVAKTGVDGTRVLARVTFAVPAGGGGGANVDTRATGTYDG